MRALGKNGVEALFLTDNPDAELLFEFFADFAHRIIRGVTGLKGRGWLKEDPGEGRTNESHKGKSGKNAESSPTEPGEEVSSAPDAPLLSFGFILCCHSFFLTIHPTDQCTPHNKDNPPQHQEQAHRPKDKREASAQNQYQDSYS